MPIRPFAAAFAALVLLTPALTRAEPQTDADLESLKTRLDSYVADKPVNATLDVRQTNTSSDDGKPRRGHVTARLSTDENGLTVRVPISEFARARTASKASVTDSNTDTTSAGMLDDFSLATARSMLDFAPALQRVLAAAKPTGKKGVTRDGQAMQLLEFDLPMAAHAKKDDDITDFSSTLKVWLNTDGVPVAVMSESHTKYRKFLISFSTNSQRSCNLAVMGTRLICRKRHEQRGGAGMGQSGKSVTESTLTEIGPPSSS